MKAHFPHGRLAPATALAALLALAPLAHASAGPTHVATALDFVLVVGTLLFAGTVFALLSAGALRANRREFDRRMQQMTTLIEHADCVLWEAEVELRGEDWHWRLTLHPSGFARQLFRGEIPRPNVDLWAKFQVDERAEMDRRAREALRTGQPRYVQEFRAVRDGQVYWLREDVSINPRGPGRFWLVGLVTDISARREAEAARRKSEETVDSILAHAQCLIWRATVVLQDGALHWPHFDTPDSQFSKLLFGDRVYSREKGFWENMSVPEQQRMNERSTQAILAGEPGYAQQFQVINQAGRTFWLHERVSITPVAEGRWSLVGVATDVTASRAAEEARRKSETRLAYLLERANCLVWEATVTLHPDDTLGWDLYTQRSVLYRRLFGERTEPGLPWHTLTVPELPEMITRALAAVKTNAPGYTQEFHVERPDEVIWLRETVTMMASSATEFRLVGVITDITAQRSAEEAQRRSELRLAELLERADCMIWQGEVRRIAPDNFAWLFFTPDSQLFRRLFGGPPPAVCDFGWDKGKVPEFQEMEQRSRHALVAGLPGYEQVFRYRHEDGDFWLNERVTIKPRGPDHWELVGIITDITAQRRSEVARQASEARLRELLGRADCLLWEANTIVAGDGWQWEFKIQPSGLCVHLYGVAEPDPQRGLWRSFDIPERAEMNRRCRTAMEEGRPGYEHVFRIRRADGSVIWISESVTIRRLGPDRYSLVGVAVDITPQRGAEEALAAEKERLAVTLRAMNEAVITTDVAGAVQFMNPAAALLTGWTEAEATGHPVAEMCRFESNRTGQKVEVPVARVARGDLVAELPPQTALRTRAGQQRVVEGCCAPIHSTESKVIGMVLVFRDVTEQERLEQELVRATRLESVGVLAGGIAHDFNNILTAIMGNLSLAQLDVPAGTPAGNCLVSAEKAALRARDLTQQLLTFAKGGEPVRAAVQLDAIVREMTSFALHGSQVKAAFDLAPDLWPADADKGQIGRVVQNLAINAVQAMPNGGTLRIMVRNDTLDRGSVPGLAPGSYLQIVIADTGEGIRPDHLGRIFDPYFTTKQTGTGLGLAAVYSIIKKHRGHIEVESQPGQGTTFRLWLPALRHGQPLSDSRPPMEAGLLAGRVLFMDDEQIIRDMAEAVLQRLGLVVDSAVDGEEAVRKYAEAFAAGRRYDAVITDLTVPGGMGGLQALRELRALDPHVKAIVSSGYSSDPVLANYREHGFVAVVAKPYELDELARVLRRVLDED